MPLGPVPALTSSSKRYDTTSWFTTASGENRTRLRSGPSEVPTTSAASSGFGLTPPVVVATEPTPSVPRAVLVSLKNGPATPATGSTQLSVRTVVPSPPGAARPLAVVEPAAGPEQL